MSLLKKVYVYFDVEIRNQGQCWVPDKVGYACIENHRKCSRKESKKITQIFVIFEP